MWYAFLSIPLLLSGDDPPQDLVQLTHGKPIKGIILRHDAEGVWLAQKTRIKHYPLEKVKFLEGPRVSWAEYLTKLKENYSQAPDAEASFQLAEWCKKKGLVREVEMHYWQALLADTNHEAANKALGHKRYKGRWRIPVRGAVKLSLKDLREHRRKDFSDAWEFTTSHFDIRCAGDLPDLIRLSVDLEILYQTFFDLFQERVGFWEIREPIKIHIYPDIDSLPKLSSTVDAHFNPDTRIIHSFFRDGVAIGLIETATHALLNRTVREYSRNPPANPGWLVKGLSIYLRTTLVGSPGDRNYDPSLIDTTFIDVQLNHAGPISIQRVLNYDAGDFTASTNQQFKFAQSYNLILFLIQHEDETKVDKFFRFLVSVYNRKASSTHFKREMEIKHWKAFESEWTTWLKAKLE